MVTAITRHGTTDGWSIPCSTAHNYDDRSTNTVINGNMANGATYLLVKGLQLQLDDLLPTG